MRVRFFAGVSFARRERGRLGLARRPAAPCVSGGGRCCGVIVGGAGGDRDYEGESAAAARGGADAHATAQELDSLVDAEEAEAAGRTALGAEARGVEAGAAVGDRDGDSVAAAKDADLGAVGAACLTALNSNSRTAWKSRTTSSSRNCGRRPQQRTWTLRPCRSRIELASHSSAGGRPPSRRMGGPRLGGQGPRDGDGLAEHVGNLAGRRGDARIAAAGQRAHVISRADEDLLESVVKDLGEFLPLAVLGEGELRGPGPATAPSWTAAPRGPRGGGPRRSCAG